MGRAGGRGFRVYGNSISFVGSFTFPPFINVPSPAPMVVSTSKSFLGTWGSGLAPIDDIGPSAQSALFVTKSVTAREPVAPYTHSVASSWTAYTWPSLLPAG